MSQYTTRLTKTFTHDIVFTIKGSNDRYCLVTLLFIILQYLVRIRSRCRVITVSVPRFHSFITRRPSNPTTNNERFDIDRRRSVAVGRSRHGRDDGIRVGPVPVLRAARQRTAD